MDEVRIGIIGFGGVAAHHLRQIQSDAVESAVVTAVCDVSPERLEVARGMGLAASGCFQSTEAFFEKAEIDALMVATPHYDHPRLAMAGFDRGLHVLIEKPAGVYTKQAREMNERAAASDRVFGIMFNCRTMPPYRKIKDLVDGGELGAIRRINWIVTDWFRTQSYYDGGGWRASWAGEGGGVLLNQCPHQLDMWQWICGMPNRLRAYCAFGKYHDIEVEDDVTAYLEYESGATGVFITSTGEAPGTNRFEVTGDRGKLVLDGGKLTFARNRVPMDEFLRESTEGFGRPECWQIDLTPAEYGGGHALIVQNWVNAIRTGEVLIAPGEDGVNSLELSNAMLLSAWTDAPIDLPIDEDAFHERLEEKIKTSTYRKPSIEAGVMDVGGSFTR